MKKKRVKPNEENGALKRNFFCLVWDMPLGLVMCGDFRIFVIEMEEVSLLFH